MFSPSYEWRLHKRLCTIEGLEHRPPHHRFGVTLNIKTRYEQTNSMSENPTSENPPFHLLLQNDIGSLSYETVPSQFSEIISSLVLDIDTTSMLRLFLEILSFCRANIANDTNAYSTSGVFPFVVVDMLVVFRLVQSESDLWLMRHLRETRGEEDMRRIFGRSTEELNERFEVLRRSLRQSRGEQSEMYPRELRGEQSLMRGTRGEEGVRRIFGQSMEELNERFEVPRRSMRQSRGEQSEMYPRELRGEQNLMRAVRESLEQFRVRTVPATKSSVDALEKVVVVEGSSVSMEQCVICLEEFGVGVVVARMPCGSHVYHEDCIVRWLETNHFCPLCKFKMPT